MNECFSYLDGIVACDLSLPLPKAIACSKPDFKITCKSTGIEFSADAELTYGWKAPDGETSVKVWADKDRHIISLHDQFHYEICDNGHLISYERRHPDLLHHLVNMVLPMAASMENRMIFHGSAVAIASKAYIFIGESGVGKSTLAASLSREHGKLICDDCFSITRTDGKWLVYPSYQSLRLWPDSVVGAMNLSPNAGTAVNSHHKKRDIPAREFLQTNSTGEAIELGKIYYLPSSGDFLFESTSIDALNPTKAFSVLLGGQFRIAKRSPEATKNEFNMISDMLRTVSVLELKHPRFFDQLDSVCKLISENVHPTQAVHW
jgi:DNA polymerase III delta prime subunit